MTAQTNSLAVSPWPTRVQRWIIAACAVLLVCLALKYGVTLAAIPRYLHRVTNLEVPTVAAGGASDVSNAIVAEDAARRGLSLAGYAVYSLVLNSVIFVGFSTAAGLVLWRHGGDWYRWLTALLLFFFPSGVFYPVLNIAFPTAAPYLGISGLLWPLFQVFLYLFPNGRLPARGWRWPMAIFVLAHAVFQMTGFLVGLVGPLGDVTVFVSLGASVILAAFVSIAACQIYRYVRVAGPVERKQIQWFVTGLTLLAVSGPVLSIVAGGEGTQHANGYLEDLDTLSGLILPAAIAVAILRYRLWDIDVIIRRTLIYSVLTATLALAYFGCVLVLESLFRALTGQGQNSLVVVLSTLAIAALFGPLRGRVQRAIDRRFFRQKYDAARTLAGFAAGARDETDLDQLSDRLLVAVDETMQPERVSLWLRPAVRPDLRNRLA